MKVAVFISFYFVLYFILLHLIAAIFKIIRSLLLRKRLILLTNIKDFILTPLNFFIFFLSSLLSFNAYFQSGVLDHYDLKRGSIEWYLVMDNDFIINFPVIRSINKPVFNHIGGDSPNISEGYEVIYESRLNQKQLFRHIEIYAKSEGHKLKEVSSMTCNNFVLDSLSNYSIFSSNDNGCVEIVFQEISNGGTRISASVLY